MAFRNINVLLTANDANLRTVMTRAGATVNKFSKEVDAANGQMAAGGKFAGTFKMSAIAIGVALGYAVTKAAQFETQMRNVNSISHLSDRALGALSARVLALSQQVPQSATTLAEGLYDIASSGFQGAEGLKVLEASAYAASAGLSTTETSARAITAVLNAYGLAASEAGYVSDVLFQTVNVGVVTFDELAGSLGDVVGFASAAGVSIAEVGSAMAAMTLAGLSAAESGTSLNRLMQALIDPSDELTTLLHKLGFESGTLALKQIGLHGVMEKIRIATGGNVEEFLKLFPEIRAARAAFALAASEGKNYNKTAREIESRTRVSGATMRAFKEQSKALGFQLKILGNQVNAIAITVGTALLPVVKAAAKALGDLIAKGVDALSDAGAALQPVWDSLVKAWANGVEIVKQMLKTIAPLVEALGLIVGTGVVGFMLAFSEAIEHTTKFLADHKAITSALSLLLAVKLVGAINAAVAGFVALKSAAIGSAMADAAAGAGRAYAAFRLLAATMGGGIVGNAKAAGVAMMQFLTSPVGAATVLTLAVLGVGNSIRSARNEGKAWAREFVDDLHINENSISSLHGGLDKTYEKLKQLRSQFHERVDAGGFAKATADIALGIVGQGDIVDSYVDTWAKINGVTEEGVNAINAQLLHLNTNLSNAFVNSGLADKWAQENSSLLAVSSDIIPQIEAQYGKLEDLPEPDTDGMISLQNVSTDTLIAVEAFTGGLEEEFNTLSAVAQKAGLDLNSEFGDALTDLVRKTVGLPPAAQESQFAIKALGEAADVGTDQVDALRDALKALIDENLGSEEAFDGLQGAINDMVASAKAADGTKIDFQAQSDDALKFRDATRGVIDEIANVVGAQAAAGAGAKQLQNIVTLLTQSFYDQAVAAGVPAKKAAEYRDILRQLPPEVLVEFDQSDLDKLLGKTKKGKEDVDKLGKKKPKPKVDADTTAFDNDMKRVNEKLRVLGETTVTPTVKLNVPPIGPPSLWTAPPTDSAKGNIFEAHDPHITKSLRVFGEPETGGEAYIPLAAAKRGRSTELLGQVAGMFGMGLIKFATGGIIAGVARNEARTGFIHGTRGGTASFAGQAMQTAREGGDAQAQWQAVRRLAEAYVEVEKAAGHAAAEQLANSGLIGDAYDEAAQKIIAAAEREKEFRRSLNDNKFATGHLGSGAYETILRRRLHSQRRFSDEWVQTWQTLNSVNQDQQERARAVNDNLYKNEKISTDKYLAILRHRMQGLRKYGDAWQAIHEQIVSVQEAAASKAADRAQQFQDVFSKAFDPLKQAADVVGAFGGQQNVALSSITDFYSHMIEATTRWRDALQKLKDLGLDAGIMQSLVAAGPQSLGFAESLLANGGAGIGGINAQTAQLLALQTQTGAVGAGILGLPTGANVGPSFSFGNISVEIGAGASAMSASEVQKMLTDAFTKLADEVKVKVS